MSAYLKSVAVQCDVTQLIGYDLFRAPAYDNMLHIITGATTCYLHRRLYVARPHITAGISCYVHKSECVCVCAASSHITRGHDLFWASACACEITHHKVYGFFTGIGVCSMLRDHTSQRARVRFVAGIGVCMLGDHTSQGIVFVTDRRVYVASAHIRGGRFATGMGEFML